MTLEEAKKILSENNIRLDERKGELRDSANYDTAYTLKPLAKGDEEAPEGFESLEDIFWRESYGKGWREHHQDFLIKIKKSSDPHVATKKLWYRIAEFMIEARDNEPCHATDIKRGLGLTGYSTSFAEMKRGGFFDTVNGGIKLSDWAVEKYREAKSHAESDRKRLESEMLKKYGTLEEQMDRYYHAVDEIKSRFEDVRREERLRDFRSARDREKMSSL